MINKLFEIRFSLFEMLGMVLIIIMGYYGGIFNGGILFIGVLIMQVLISNKYKMRL